MTTHFNHQQFAIVKTSKNSRPLFFLMVVLLQLMVSAAFAQNTATVKTDRNYPVFTLQTLDGKTVATDSYRKEGRHTIIMYFSPTCHHCRAQTEQITGNIKLFSNADWLLVSAYPVDQIKQFIQDMGLSSFKNIALAYDPEFSLGEFLALDEIPGIFVYSPEGQLLKQIRKTTTAEKIAETLQ